MRRFLIILLTFAFYAPAFAQTVPGEPLPKFQFVTLSGKPFTHTSVTGGKKSIFILFDIGCDHCQREMVAIGKRFNEFAGNQFYLVSMDEKPGVEKFMKNYGKNLYGQKNVSVLLDPNRAFVGAFLPRKLPSIYIFSPSNKLVWHQDGEQGVDEILKAAKG
jgi:hypothetical protein